MLDVLLYPLAVLGAGVAAVLLFLLVTGLCATVDLGSRRSRRPGPAAPAARDGAAG